MYPFILYHLGQCLGLSDNLGSEICYLILIEIGKFIPVGTVRSLTPSEKNNPEIKEDITRFDMFISKIFQ